MPPLALAAFLAAPSEWAIIGACLGLAAAVFLFIFYIQPDASDLAPHRTKLDQLLERRDTIYDNLRDLRFEYRSGKYAQGDFTFDHPGLGAQRMLVRAVYHGVNFNRAVPPGTSTVQVDIYEASKDAKTINVPSHVVVFQPNGATLIVGEQYQIENKSQPPVAY